MKTVFFDVDTQLDFLFPAGALYVPGAEEIVPVLGKLTQHARARNWPILSTADAHEEDDAEFRIWKPHCVGGTTGQLKATVTLAGPQPSILTTDPGCKLEANIQTIIEKQHTDCFTNPNLLPLLQQLAAERFVVYGVVSEVCVRFAALGLLTTGAKVEIVTDAIRHLSSTESEAMLKEFTRRGGTLTSSASLLAA